MKASDWALLRERAALRRGAILAAGPAVILGIGLMLGVHLALSMRSDAIHESAQATIREAEKILLADRGLIAAASECRGIVEDVAEDKFENVVNYKRQIVAIQTKTTNAQ